MNGMRTAAKKGIKIAIIIVNKRKPPIFKENLTHTGTNGIINAIGYILFFKNINRFPRKDFFRYTRNYTLKQAQPHFEAFSMTFIQ